MNYYNVKISYEKEIDFENVKRIVEYYVVKSNEIELKDIIENYLQGYVGKKLVCIESVNKMKISDVLFFEGEKFFVVKLRFLVENVETGAIRKATEQFIVRAEGFEKAVVQFKKTICDKTLTENFILSVRELNVVDVMNY